MVFLVDSDAPLDGLAGHKTTTLLGASIAREERISMFLMRRGAFLYAEEICTDSNTMSVRNILMAHNRQDVR